jgi:acyl-CoA thioester hydrolase
LLDGLSVSATSGLRPLEETPKTANALGGLPRSTHHSARSCSAASASPARTSAALTVVADEPPLNFGCGSLAPPRCVHSWFSIAKTPLMIWSVPGERFRYSQRVTYSHCTIGDHVYYSRYLEMLETARGEFLRALGDTFAAWQAKGVIFPVIECRLSYKSPARYDDVLSIELFVTVAERARLNFGYRITSENGTLILEGETWHVCTDLKNKPRRLPEDLLARLEPFEAI